MLALSCQNQEAKSYLIKNLVQGNLVENNSCFKAKLSHEA